MNCQKCHGSGEWVSPVSRYGCPSRCPECYGTGTVVNQDISSTIPETQDLDLRIAELEAIRKRNSELLIDNTALRNSNASLRKRVAELEQELREFAAAVSGHDCRAQRAEQVTAVASPSGRRKRATGSTAEIPVQSMAEQVFGQEKEQG